MFYKRLQIQVDFISHGAIIGRGENTVAQSTRDFEQKEVGGNFYKLMSEFGPKARNINIGNKLSDSTCLDLAIAKQKIIIKT